MAVLVALAAWVGLRHLMVGRKEQLHVRLTRLAGGPDAADRLRERMRERYPESSLEDCYRLAIEELLADRK
ncbi:MAG: hypothetical protein JST54_10310 [Deltaproteobacteria bacterium]|nr:hypothetical protein [Deltaproteobacteria bacterium]